MLRQRLLVTIAAGITAMALSASGAWAAPAAKVTPVIKVAKSCAAQGAPPKTNGQKPMKPAKAEKANKGKHLGQQKQETKPDEVEAPGERKQNHGWFVSQVAKDKSLTGREHGKAVSDVAKSDQGKP